MLKQFTLYNYESRHKGSHLGLVWSLLNPLLQLSLYFFVFGVIFGGNFGVLPGETRWDYALGLLLGLTLFHLMAEVLGIAPTVIVANPNFVKKVVFPLDILPVASVGASTIHLLISLVMVMAGVVFLGSGLDIRVLWLPVIYLPILLTTIGLAWLLSALGVFFRDITQLTGFLSMALMFASAIFYPAHRIPSAAWQFLRFNPLLLAVEQSRDVVLWGKDLNPHHIAYLYIVGVGLFLFGHWCFRRLAPAFSDVI